MVPAKETRRMEPLGIGKRNGRAEQGQTLEKMAISNR